MKCPCHSGQSYATCCQPYHDGRLPPDALTLMRSRYAAYALNLPAYIIATTHPSNKSYTGQTDEWEKCISSFATTTQFDNLTIVNTNLGKKSATVTFTAHLTQDGQDVSFTETSQFQRVGDRWLYVSGQIHS